MNAFFVAIVVLGCAWSAHAQSGPTPSVPCTYPNGGNGGVFGAGDTYIASNTRNHILLTGGSDGKISFSQFCFCFFNLLDSVLTWVDVANNAKQWADADGLNILENWILASESFNSALEASPQLYDVAANTLRQADLSFGLLSSHIVGNPGLAQFLADTYTSFGAVLDNGTYDDINAYMINALPNFQYNICGSSN